MPPQSSFLSEQGYASISAFDAHLAENQLRPFINRLELRVFGSIARGAAHPSDFDLAIVYSEREYFAARSLRKWVRRNSDGIQSVVGVRVNILVLSKAEFDEIVGKLGPTVALPLDY